jgi:hypothetical protein
MEKEDRFCVAIPMGDQQLFPQEWVAVPRDLWKRIRRQIWAAGQLSLPGHIPETDPIGLFATAATDLMMDIEDTEGQVLIGTPVIHMHMGIETVCYTAEVSRRKTDKVVANG